MASIVVLMISTIAIIAITGDAIDLNTDWTSVEMEACPYLEDAEYAATVKGPVSGLISGCAYINKKSSDIKAQKYSFWFENKHNGPKCSERGIEYFHFYCLSKPSSPSADIKKGRMYINREWAYNETADNTEGRRCALYEKIDNYDTTLRVAISKGCSCDGLSGMLNHPELPWDSNGSLLMVFNTNRPVTTTTESIQSISNRFERRKYILQNYGNGPNPFHRKINETKNDGKRTQRSLKITSDEDDRSGAVLDLASSYDGLQPDIIEKDVTTKDTNWLRGPLEMNDMQLRRRRSKANVMPTSKSDVIVLAGANPFALLLSNRVRNNKTGSIKPLGLWEQIVKIFNN